VGLAKKEFEKFN